MSKCLLSVTSILALVLITECRFVGDSCHDDGRPGTCKLLSDCSPLLQEVKRSGTPMPGRLRAKLKDLMCGFQSDHPIVCCVSPFTNENDDHRRPLFPPYPGLGVPLANVDDTINSESNPSWDTVTSGFLNDATTPKSRPLWDTVNSGSNNEATTPRSGLSNNNRNNNKNGDSNEAPDVRGHRNFHLLPTDCGVIESDRILGGNRTSLYEMPWMVLIAYNSGRGTKLSCGGTLINERYVLTAAHCVTFLGDRLKLAGVVLGEYDVRSDPDCERTEGDLVCAPSIRNVSIDTIIPHPGYSPQNLFDDIALIRLSEPADISLDSMKPICLPSTPELQAQSMVGREATVAGWGATEDGLQSPVLLRVALPVVSNEDCQAAYNGSPRIYNRQMCAGGVQNKDSCGGDSGGPLMYPGTVGRGGLRYVQRGIVSYGSKRCGIGGYPGVYTRVGHYMDWILDNIRD